MPPPTTTAPARRRAWPASPDPPAPSARRRRCATTATPHCRAWRRLATAALPGTLPRAAPRTWRRGSQPASPPTRYLCRCCCRSTAWARRPWATHGPRGAPRGPAAGARSWGRRQGPLATGQRRDPRGRRRSSPLPLRAPERCAAASEAQRRAPGGHRHRHRRRKRRGGWRRPWHRGRCPRASPLPPPRPHWRPCTASRGAARRRRAAPGAGRWRGSPGAGRGCGRGAGGCGAASPRRGPRRAG
mmetsp:Transcript_27364/g.78855  ORF Transcript_27364/g.78855 Transcript_27364/m.78855 type:complete len:244 (-) Transcript_27364:1606-2337(-)